MRVLASGIVSIVLLCGVAVGAADDSRPVAEAQEREQPNEIVVLPETEQASDDPLIAEEVRHRLLTTVTFRSEGDPLLEVVKNQIATPANVEIYFNSKMIESASINLDDLTVTGDFRNTTVRSVLTRILAASDLAFYCDDTGVCITTKENHDEWVFARVYDVTDLIREKSTPPVRGPYYSSPTGGLSGESTNSKSTNSPALPVRSVQFGGGGFGGGLPIQQPTADPCPPLTAVALQSTIEQACGTNESWHSQSGLGTVSIINTGRTKLMVVRQTEAIHVEVEDLLTAIHSHHHMSEVEENIAPPEPVAPPKSAQINVIQPKLQIVKHRKR